MFDLLVRGFGLRVKANLDDSTRARVVFVVFGADISNGTLGRGGLVDDD